MIKLIKLSLIVVTFTLLTTGCATIVNGSSQDITINTTPPGANVKIINTDDNTEVGKFVTPCVVELDRSAGFFQKGSYILEIEKPGFGKKTVNVRGQVDGWYLVGNFFFGSFLGWLIIDPASGAMWQLKPDKLNIVLTADGALNEIEYKNGNLIINKNDLSKEQLKSLGIE